MPRPGTDVVITDSPTVVSAILDTGQTFMLGVSERGSATEAEKLKSLTDFERKCGPRSGGVVAYDSVRATFAEQSSGSGSPIYFARVVGPNAVAASGTVGVLQVSAVSPGVWGDSLAVALEATGLMAAVEQARAKPTRRQQKNDDESEQPTVETRVGETVRVVVKLGGKTVESSPLFSVAEQAVAWSQGSAYIRATATNPSAPLTAVPAVTLAGGTDDPSVTAATVEAALDRFGYELGPGQVTYPGQTTAAMQDLIMAHCDKNKRCCLLDEQSTADATILAAEAVGRYGKAGVRMAAALAPPLMYPGPSGGSGAVPYSAIQAGIIARQDRLTGNPGQAAAGVNGVSLYALGLAHNYSDDEREELNELGITLAKERYGQVRTYGSRTAAGPADSLWEWFAGSRVVMAIAHEADAAAENYVHTSIDGRGHRFAELETDLIRICSRFWNMDALYGATAEEAFRIDTRSQNTIDTIKAGEIHALIRLKTSPTAEWVLIEINKVDLAATL